MSKTSESQRNADKRWREKNRWHSNYLKNRASARCFIRNKATLEDLKELERIIKERRNYYNSLNVGKYDKSRKKI